MDPPKNEPPKLPDMVMCGDHPSITKTELNGVVRDLQLDIKDTIKKDKPSVPNHISYARISPTSSRTERSERAERSERSERSERAERAERSERCERWERRRAASEHAVRGAGEARGGRGSAALLRAALGSFRWPPYLVCAWVVVLVVTHALHCAAALLDRTLPPLRNFCQYFRMWTEESWRTETDLNHRIYPIGLACVTSLLYTLYFSLYLLYCVALWFIEPLCSDLDEKQSVMEMESRITNYVEEINRSNSIEKP